MNHTKKFLSTLLVASMVLILIFSAIPVQAAKPNFRPAITPGPLTHRQELRATVNVKTRLAHVELRIDNKKVQPWVKAHTGWKYTVLYPMNKFAVGMHTATLQAWDQQNRTSRHQWQFQKLDQLALTAGKTEVRSGEKVTLTGQGFTPGTAITVGMGDRNTGISGNYGSSVAGPSGAFTVEVTLDKFPDGSPLHAGTITLLAHNSDGSEKAGVEVRVLPAPRLVLDKSTIKPGDAVRVTGEGFTPGKTVTIRLAGVNMGHGDRYGTVLVDTDGNFSIQLALARYPDGTPLPPGGITLTASTGDGERARASLQLVATPAIAPDKTMIRSGDQITLSGEGFTPGATISISMGPVNGGTGGTYGTAMADTNGRFKLPVTLALYPDGSPLGPGTIVLLAHTADFTEKAGTQLQVLARPAITIDRTSVQPGERVTITGKGFTPGATIFISLGGGDMQASGTYSTALADARGSFTLAVLLERYPNGLPLAAGQIVLVAHNASWDEKASAPLQVMTLSATPTSIARGDVITLKGEGFAAGSTVILSMAMNGAAPSGNFGTAVTDAHGRFVLTARLTQYPGGSPLQPGPLVLAVHDSSWNWHATTQIAVLDRGPTRPSDLRITSLTRGATSAEPTSVGLQWQDNSSNETGFRIQATYTRMNRGTDTQVWHVPANATTGKVSFMAGGINPVNKACFTVTALGGQDSSSPSNEVCATL